MSSGFHHSWWEIGLICVAFFCGGVMCWFSPASLKIVFLYFWFLAVWLLCGCFLLWVYFAWDLMNFYREVFSHSFFKYFFSAPISFSFFTHCLTAVTWILDHLILSQISLSSLHLLFILFSLRDHSVVQFESFCCHLRFVVFTHLVNFFKTFNYCTFQV